MTKRPLHLRQLRAALALHDMTQGQLAAMARMNAGTVSLLLSGRLDYPEQVARLKKVIEKLPPPHRDQ